MHVNCFEISRIFDVENWRHTYTSAHVKTLAVSNDNIIF